MKMERIGEVIAEALIASARRAAIAAAHSVIADARVAVADAVTNVRAQQQEPPPPRRIHVQSRIVK
jgi:hypothetical protein